MTCVPCETVASWFVEAFARAADGLAKLYGAPIWLVGSALTKERPRDIDIRIVLCECEMRRRYGTRFPQIQHGGYTLWEWRRAVDNIKQSRALMNYGGYPIDLQIQSQGEAAPYATRPRIRLDTAPAWVQEVFALDHVSVDACPEVTSVDAHQKSP